MISLRWLLAAACGFVQVQLGIASEKSAPRLRVPDGFTIERAAGPPDVVYPMFGVLDERGGLYVAESSGLDLYAELSAQTRKCRVRLLQDKDGDGRFETSKVYADRLVFPMGLAWREGRLYVADPPDLAVYEDQNGDGQADRREVILSGFGHRDNGSLHGLIFGPDDLLYMTMGSPDGYRLTRADGTVLQGESGALIRCRPDGSDPEVLSRGFVNLVEVAFLSDGSILGTDNWFQEPAAGMRDALVHLAEGGLYPYHPDIGTPYPVTGNPLPPVSLYPAVALSGLMYYRGSAFPAEMRANLFSAQHNSRKVGRHQLERDGATFRASDFDLVTTEDPDFHPSDVLEDADGSLLVVDTGSWYVHHCPTGKIRETHAPGGIYRVRWEAAARTHDPWGTEIHWPKMAASDLTELLEDPRHAVRERAAAQLAKQGANAQETLRRFLGSEASLPARELAAWALGRMTRDDGLAILRELLAGEAPSLAVIAARGLGLRGDRLASRGLQPLLASPLSQVQFAAAEALARCGDPEAVPAVWTALRRAGEDPFLRHALIHAAHRLADTGMLERALADPDPVLQSAALVLLDQPPRHALGAEAVLERAAASDPGLKATALGILRKHPEWSASSVRFIQGLLSKTELDPDERNAVPGLLRAYENDKELQTFIGTLLEEEASAGARARRTFLLETLLQTALRPLPSSWRTALRSCLTRGTYEEKVLAVRLIHGSQAADFNDPLLQIAQDASAQAPLRLEALRAARLQERALPGSCFQLVLDQFRPETSPVLRLTAAEILGHARLSHEQARALINATQNDPLVAPGARLRLWLQTGSSDFELVLRDLESVLGRGWQPAIEEWESILKHSPAPRKTAVQRLMERAPSPLAEHGKRLERFLPLLHGGDEERGRNVFFGAKAVCATCHRAGREGGLAGPDLTKIGAIRSGRDLVESIVLPSSTLAQGYEAYTLQLKDGREFDGVIVNREAARISLRTASGAEIAAGTNEVQALVRRSQSLMPEGLDAVLSEQEFRDLLSYLQSLK